MLAPVLARLSRIPGVASARVEATGRFFWLSLQPAADAARVAALASGALGSRARVLSPAEAEAQLAAHPHGDPWLGPGEVMALSLVESRVLSVRLSDEAARTIGATAEQREVLAEAIRAELFLAMERVHAEGGRASGGWIHDEWPALAAAAAARCAGKLPTGVQVRLAGVLPGVLRR